MSVTNGVSEKRFRLSGEAFAKERLRGAKTTIDDLRREHPEILSLCMFGSMVKGNAKPESDIDGYLFVDADSVPDAQLVSQQREGSTEVLFDQHTQDFYTTMIRDRLKNQNGLKDEQVRHVRVRPISESIIGQELGLLSSWAIAAEQHEQTIAPFERGERSWADAPPDLRPPDYVLPSENLSAMFQLDVGGGISRYRTSLLEKLSSLGDRGERIWQLIVRETESLEQRFHWDTKLAYPRTLAEARKVYSRR